MKTLKNHTHLSEHKTYQKQYRKIGTSNTMIKLVDLLIFNDASKNAYGATAYLIQNNSISIKEFHLIFARNRVKLNSNLTILKLELQEVVLATQKTQLLSDELHVTINHI